MVQKVISFELELCLLINSLCNYRFVRPFFSAISRIGNGMFWYLLILLLPLVYGQDAMRVSISMFVTGLTGLLIYKLIKSITERPRPYTVNHQINLGSAPLDQYSFPSGHTLHAFSFSIIACAEYPELSWLLIPITILIAASRIILGLHYPTDVIAGAVIGSSLGISAVTF